MKKFTATAAKRALVSTDPIVLGEAIRHLLRNGYDYSSMYRLALATDPSISRDSWSDRYLEGLKAASPFGKLELGGRIRAGSRTYTVQTIDWRAGVVELSTGRSKRGSLITLMESGVDEGKFVIASPQKATTYDSFEKL